MNINKYSFKAMALSAVSALVIAPLMPLTAYAAPTDSSAPTVSITAPANGATVSGTVTVSASASDTFSSCVIRIFGQYYDVSVLGSTHSGGNVFVCGTNQDALYSSIHGTNVNRIVPYLLPSTYVGVTKMELYIDGTKVLENNFPAGPTSTIAYTWNTNSTFSWNSASVANGSHSIQVKAYDGTNVSTSATVNVTVSNTTTTTPPTSAITSPTTASTVSGTVSVAADATAVPSVSKVEFYVDGSLKATDTTSPYTFAWDTTQVANGSHTLQAKAYDPSNNVGSSSVVTVTVNNTTTTPPSDTTAPMVSITSPSNGATISGVTSIDTNATDNVGVTKVEFYANGTLIGTDTTQSTANKYSFDWNTASVQNGQYTLTAKAYDAANNSTVSSGVTIVVNNSTTTPPPTGHHDDDDDEDEDEHGIEHENNHHENEGRKEHGRSGERNSSGRSESQGQRRHGRD